MNIFAKHDQSVWEKYLLTNNAKLSETKLN